MGGTLRETLTQTCVQLRCVRFKASAASMVELHTPSSITSKCTCGALECVLQDSSDDLQQR